MNAVRLGLFQQSTDRFALAVHAEAPPVRQYQEFSAHYLCAEIVVGPSGAASVEFEALPASVAQARTMLLETMERDPSSVVTGAVMAVDTASDSWHLTVLPDTDPAYHVALAFSLYPLFATFAEGRLVHMAYDVVAQREAGPSWQLLHPAIAAQAAAIVFPDAPTLADGCALLATRPGLLDYLRGLGRTFSLGDIEQLARMRQGTSSIVHAQAQGMQGEDLSWMYCVKLSERAIRNAGLLALSYARAKTRVAAGLRSRPAREGLSQPQIEFREAQVERMAHHLALLALCVEYGIGLWSSPSAAQPEMSLDDEEDELQQHWPVAVMPE